MNGSISFSAQTYAYTASSALTPAQLRLSGVSGWRVYGRTAEVGEKVTGTLYDAAEDVERKGELQTTFKRCLTYART